MATPDRSHPASARDWEAEIEAFWDTVDLDDPDTALARMRALVARRPDDDPDAWFELGGVHDCVGDEAAAQEAYDRARSLGLAGPRLAQLDLQQGSTLRNLGRLDEALALLSAIDDPDASLGAAPAVFRALALRDAGRTNEALRTTIEALVPGLPRYQRSAAAYAADLTAVGSLREAGYEVFHPTVGPLVDFYVTVLGFTADATGDTAYATVRRGGLQVGCSRHDDAEPHPAGRRPPLGSEIVLRVADVDAEHDRVLRAGWPLADELQRRPWGQRDFRVFDPSGQYVRITGPTES